MGEELTSLLGLGGPVVVILLALSILALSVIIYKIWDLQRSGVGRHGEIRNAIAAIDDGRTPDARDLLRSSRNHLAPIFENALQIQHSEKARLTAEAEGKMARVEKGFRLLDSIAQIAPLLGLFGTVLGMIAAFQALQEAGQAVDPSALAGGIWVALLTTAGGLAIAMPTTLALSWLESRTEADRVIANVAIEALTAAARVAETGTPSTAGLELVDAG
jgi:biopolymer transport protein ExbB